MTKSTTSVLAKIHDVVFAIMCDIDEYCLENNITYYLSGGSCLGAIREHGFIPWDHDADLMMPREDYERFLRGFQEKCKGKYHVASLETDKEWSRQYAKIWDMNTILREKKTTEKPRGVAVDIFPIDGLPEKQFARKIFYKKTKVIAECRKAASRKELYDHEKHRVIRKVMTVCLKPIGSRFFAIILQNMAKRYPFASSKLVGVSMACHYWDRETIEKEHLSYPVRVPFEGKNFPVPNGYERYLTNLYGDYMKVPQKVIDVENRIIDAWELVINVDGTAGKFQNDQ